MKRIFGIILLGLIVGSVNAQDILKGTVRESGTNNKLPEVFIKDNSNKQQVTLTDKDGNFQIKTATGHILIFSAPGYISDTLYLVDLKPKKMELRSMSISLREVNINSSRDSFDPHTEYPDVYEKSKVYVMSPSTWFSKEGKDARRLKKYFEKEAQERHIDEVYTKTYVGSIVPLKGEELETFMTLYRPTYAFLKNNNGPSLVTYINDSYKKYLALPPEKRKMQTLTSQ
jgi:hypothetical protein